MKSLITILLMFCFVCLTSCAHYKNVDNCISKEDLYGFWGGLWHGIIVVFSFIGHLFNSDIVIYAPNNNGGWYMFGFLLGIGAFGGSASKATTKK